MYILNLEKSYELYESHKELLEDGFCYSNNIELLVKRYLKEFQNNELYIGYCYLGGEIFDFQRHCVIVSNNNEIIDVSIPFKYNYIEALTNTTFIKYYFFGILNLEELSAGLIKDNTSADLKISLKEKERELVKELLNNNVRFNKSDYMNYVKELE